MLSLYLFEAETEVVLIINIRIFQNASTFHIEIASKGPINYSPDGII